jgi:uncharacterized protein (DUF1778 family)
MSGPSDSKTRSSRSSRLGLRATREQEAVLRKAAEASGKSLTEFILDSACLAAEQTLLDQRLFLVSNRQYRALLEMLDQPVYRNRQLQDLFATPAPWDAP